MGYKAIVRASYSKNLNRVIRGLNSLQKDRNKVIKYLEVGEKELLRKANQIDLNSPKKIEKLFLTTEIVKYEIERANELGLLTNAEAEYYKWKYDRLKDEIKAVLKQKAIQEAERKADELAMRKLRSIYGNLADDKILAGKRAMLRNKYVGYFESDRKINAILQAESSVLAKLRKLLLRKENEEVVV